MPATGGIGAPPAVGDERTEQAGAAPARRFLHPSIRYTEALGWASELHRRHPRELRAGELLSPIARALAVSVLVWEDGGDEDLAIAALLPEAIGAGGQCHRAVGERFGERVADLAVACRPFAQPLLAASEPPSPQLWVQACRSRLLALRGQAVPPLRVITAQLAQEARETWQVCLHRPMLWDQLPAGLEGAAWYWLRLHQLLCRAVPGSPAIERLAAVLQSLLNSPLYGERVPAGLAPTVWAARFDDRCLRMEPWPDLAPPAPLRSAVVRE